MVTGPERGREGIRLTLKSNKPFVSGPAGPACERWRIGCGASRALSMPPHTHTIYHAGPACVRWRIDCNASRAPARSTATPVIKRVVAAEPARCHDRLPALYGRGGKSVVATVVTLVTV